MLPILFTVGLLYLLAVVAGRLSAAVGIPRVTGYLVVGLLAGPSAAAGLGLPAVITSEQLGTLKPLHDLIIGLIVFTIGGSLDLKAIRRIGSTLFRISVFEIGMTSLLVGGATLMLGAPPLGAAFLAVISITTAPAATQMVMREYQSEGRLSDTILPLIGINNLVAIIAFTLLLQSDPAMGHSFWRGVFQVLAPVGLGGITGLAIAVLDQRFARRVERQMLVLGAIAVTSGVCALLDLSAMFCILISGMIAVNASYYGNRLLEDLSVIDYPFYVLFFIMAGADLHLEQLVHMGLIGIAYVAARTVGKYAGCRLGARLGGTDQRIRRWLGPAMLAQAGLAIGLAEILVREYPVSGKSLQTVVLAAVVIFEISGPLLIRTALVRAGEVPLFNLISQPSPLGFGESLRRVLNHFKKALGFAPAAGMGCPSQILVKHLMRPNVEVVSNRASFYEVLKALRHSRYDRLPVVNDQDELVGVIKYGDIAHTLFEPELQKLVKADEIATGAYQTLTPEDTLETALQVLNRFPQEIYLLVVAGDNPRRLMGIVGQSDILSTRLPASG